MEDPFSTIEASSPVTGRRRCLSGLFSWRPTSKELLRLAEERILRHVRTPYKGRFIGIGNNRRIWTARFNEVANPAMRVPLVLVHGFAGGIGLWAQNLDSLAKDQQLYTFDLLGFGRSSRTEFSKEADSAEDEFVESIESWRKEVGLEKFVLLGHSLGGFLASSYTIKHPQHVKHLILADPWGFPEKPSDEELAQMIPSWMRTVGAILSPFNPLAALRASGPWGPSLIQKMRPDLDSTFSRLFGEDDDTVTNYIYHCNAQKPSGEAAFKNMAAMYGWAKNPMLPRIHKIDPQIPITFIYGSMTWMDQVGHEVKYIRRDSYVNVEVVRSAGHHVYADQPANFNNIVQRVMDRLGNESTRNEETVEEESDFEIVEK